MAFTARVLGHNENNFSIHKDAVALCVFNLTQSRGGLYASSYKGNTTIKPKTEIHQVEPPPPERSRNDDDDDS